MFIVKVPTSQATELKNLDLCCARFYFVSNKSIKNYWRVDRTEPIQFGFTKASKFTILIFIHEGPKFKDHLGLYLTEITLTSKLSIAKNELISDSKQVLLLGSMKSMKLVIRLHFISWKNSYSESAFYQIWVRRFLS